MTSGNTTSPAPWPGDPFACLPDEAARYAGTELETAAERAMRLAAVAARSAEMILAPTLDAFGITYPAWQPEHLTDGAR